MPVVIQSLGTSGTGISTSDVTTAAGATERALRYLSPYQRADIDVLDVAVDAATEAVVLRYGNPSVRIGSIIVIGYEVMRVVNVSGNNVTVVRGHFGTVAQAHGEGDEIEVEPRFPRPFVFEELRSDILALPSNLYRTVSVEVSVSKGIDAFDVSGATDVLHLLSVEVGPPTSVERWNAVPAATLRRNQNSTDFPSGFAIFLPGPASMASTYRVTYASPFVMTTFNEATSLTDDVGLPTSLLDAPAYGAAYRILMTREAPRSSSNALAESRRGEEVPPMHISQAAQQFRALRNELVDEEIKRQLHRYPIRSRGV